MAKECKITKKEISALTDIIEMADTVPEGLPWEKDMQKKIDIVVKLRNKLRNC